jgi:hypothetical protein
MKAFAGLAVAAVLIVAIPVANAQTWARHDAGKSPNHAASHSNSPHFIKSLQTMLRHLLRPQTSMSHVARHSVPLPPPESTEVAAMPAERAAQAKAAYASSSPPNESTGTVNKANPPTPQILPTQDMPAVQGLEMSPSTPL